MPLKTIEQLMEDDDPDVTVEDNAAWLRWMLADEPPRYLVAAEPATIPVADVAAWARFMTHPLTRETFRSFETLPVEVDRIPDPIDPETVLIRWRVIHMSIDLNEQDAA